MNLDNNALKELLLRSVNEAKTNTVRPSPPLSQPQSYLSSCLPELFCILHYSSLDCTELDEIITWGLSSQDVGVLRHCLGMLLSLFEVNPARAQTLLSSMLSDQALATLISEDEIASVCSIRCCWALYQATKSDAVLKYLAAMACQGVVASRMLAMELLSLLPYEVLSTLPTSTSTNKDSRITERRRG